MLSCYLLFRLGIRVFDERIGRLASYIYAAHPISFWYTTRFASEMVAIPILLFCLLVILRFFTEPSQRKAVEAGLSLGVAALTKSAYAMLLPLVLLFVVVRLWRNRRAFIAPALIVVLSFAGVYSLWLVRNFAISGEIVPFTTMNGVIFFVGNQIVERFDVKALTAGEEPDRRANELYASVQAEIFAREPDMTWPRLEAETDKRLRAMATELALSRPSFIVRKLLTGLVHDLVRERYYGEIVGLGAVSTSASCLGDPGHPQTTSVDSNHTIPADVRDGIRSCLRTYQPAREIRLAGCPDRDVVWKWRLDDGARMVGVADSSSGASTPEEHNVNSGEVEPDVLSGADKSP